MLAALGLFVFDAIRSPFVDWTNKAEWRHVQGERVGALAASQFVGPGEETISISGALIPEAGASYSSLAILRALAEQGEALPFVDGGGQVWGYFVITALDQRRRNITIDGLPRVVDFALDLRRTA